MICPHVSRYVLLSIGVTLLAAIVFVLGEAGASTPPFKEISAAESITALQAPPASSAPTAILALPPEMQPASPIHELGTGVGYAWTRDDGSVCLLMSGGPGGCLTTFRKPVLLYLAGVRTAAGVDSDLTVWGLVPDEVARLSLVTDRGTTVSTEITANAFKVSLPPGTSIAGEEVALRDGTTFYEDDPVSGDAGIPPPPAAG